MNMTSIRSTICPDGHEVRYKKSLCPAVGTTPASLTRLREHFGSTVIIEPTLHKLGRSPMTPTTVCHVRLEQSTVGSMHSRQDNTPRVDVFDPATITDRLRYQLCLR